MNPLDALTTYAVVGLPLGLAAGLALGLVARHAGGWGGYASFRRRAARLGHVALVMLPLIAGFYALAASARALDPATLAWAARLWIAGSLGLALALFAAAWRPSLVVTLPLPALSVTAGALAFAVAWLDG
jgi:hypothetical protein